jgi:oligopeptide/dipeptide ABC transporter ATP-binding protein
MAVLDVKDLRTYFFLDEGVLKAVDGVSLRIEQGKTLGVIGESGCGKSVTAQSVLRIVPDPGRIMGGQILLSRPTEEMARLHEQAGLQPKDTGEVGGTLDLAGLDERGPLIRAIRGKVISMIFQEPMTSLSPVHTVGSQIMEAILLHRTRNQGEAREIALQMLDRVGISNPAQRIDEYPHQLSGGMRQRAMIAMALSCHPALLVADEPTTALDVTVQAQILELIKELQGQLGMGIQYITHDLGVISEVADEVAVMYLGRVVEKGTVRQIFKNPLHPYTERLLRSIPRLGKRAGLRLDAIKGTVPIPLDPPFRCGFYSRCPVAIQGRCDAAVPALADPGGDGHQVRCFLHGDQVEKPGPSDEEIARLRRRGHRAVTFEATPVEAGL